MKKVKLLTTMAGPEGCFVPGQVIDVDEKKAKELISGGYAEAVEEKTVKPAEAEAAAIEPPEKAVKKPPRRKKAVK